LGIKAKTVSAAEFIPCHGAANMEAVVTERIGNLGLDVSSLAGQSYDNASNMSGIYSGLQARIQKFAGHYI
jgi:hypothetical protein